MTKETKTNDKIVQELVDAYLEDVKHCAKQGFNINGDEHTSDLLNEFLKAPDLKKKSKSKVYKVFEENFGNKSIDEYNNLLNKLSSAIAPVTPQTQSLGERVKAKINVFMVFAKSKFTRKPTAKVQQEQERAAITKHVEEKVTGLKRKRASG